MKFLQCRFLFFLFSLFFSIFLFISVFRQFKISKAVKYILFQVIFISSLHSSQILTWHELTLAALLSDHAVPRAVEECAFVNRHRKNGEMVATFLPDAKECV